MLPRVMFIFISVMFSVSTVNAQRGGDTFNPLPQRTVETDREALRLMRNDKLDLVLPGAMRDNNMDMWIHVTRGAGIFARGNPEPMAQQFGRVSGYLIFTDLGDRIERAVFGSAGIVENIDIQGSLNVARAFGGYNYNNLDPRQSFSVPEVYDEIREFVAERDPQRIAVNYSELLPVADGISNSQYLKFERILGPKYSQRIVSAENVILDFIVRRTSREIAAQTEVLALARQRGLQNIAKIVPGVTTIGDISGRLYYSAGTNPEETVKDFPPDARLFLNNPDYVLQRGDFFVGGGGGGPRGSYMGFGVDTKIHCYILREGETKVPEFLQYAWDQGKKAQGIIQRNVRVGMTAGESLEAIVKAMEEAGYIFTPLTDVGTEDYKEIQEALANTDKSGFYL